MLLNYIDNKVCMIYGNKVGMFKIKTYLWKNKIESIKKYLYNNIFFLLTYNF